MISDPYQHVQQAEIERMIEDHNKYIAQRSNEFTEILVVMRDNYGGTVIPAGECASVHPDVQLTWGEVKDDYPDDTPSEIISGFTMTKYPDFQIIMTRTKPEPSSSSQASASQASASQASQASNGSSSTGTR